MSLHDYQRKRDFTRTREPSGDAGHPVGARAIFVVQLHHASSRHYDFRLQIGDVLKSWAVPKGPSFDPKDKRLAVEVEDHPLSYADFEGDIAEGYGKGHVDQFDHGVWSTTGDVQTQLRKGHLRFQLFGRRLQGEWHLVRSHRKERQPAWFLIKVDDAFAGKLEADDLLDARMRASTRKAAKKSAKKVAAGKSKPKGRPARGARKVVRSQLLNRIQSLPEARRASLDGDFYKPELARLFPTPPAGEDWLHEVKWDGYRLLATVHDGAVALWSRNGLSWTTRLPEIVAALEAMGVDEARFDGELIALDASGHSDFNALQKTLSGEANAPLMYMMFDCPALEGHDLSRVPLHQRKALLAYLLEGRPAPLAFSTHTQGHGDDVFRMAVEHRLEGIMSKRHDSAYHAGRGDDWRKIKRTQSDEFAVLGYTRPRGSRTKFGALLLGSPDPADAARWIYAGRVGSGFSEADLASIGRSIATGGRSNPPVPIEAIDPLLRDALWVKPESVVEVFFRGLGGHRLLRQASFKALRPDKSAADLIDPDHARTPRTATMKASPSDPPSSAVTITHPERVVYPGDSIRKADVADYYRAVMDWFLPGVMNRPTSVLRCPDGIDKACFFQKHAIAGLKHIQLLPLVEESGAKADYLVPRDASSVLELVQFGALEFHPWGATAQAPDAADRLVFDLDPGPDVRWERVVAAARLLRGKLEELGLQSFLRTTGGKGLHVVVPLRPAIAWSDAKRFAHAFASSLAQAHPAEFVAVAAKAQRKGRIYLDYLRNSRGATSIASYSLRAREGAPVAVPLRWDELGRIKAGNHYTLRNLPSRLARLRADPWEGMDKLEQDLGNVLEALASDHDG